MNSVPALSLIVVGLFLSLQGINAIRTRHFATGIQSGPPAVVLGAISLVVGLVLIGGTVYFVQTIQTRGY